MQQIPLDKEIERFQTHLQDNPRVIFSAKYGDGKSFFLKSFEENTKDDIRIITLHPINYAIASNEDIFEYIKRDIIVQLQDDGIYEAMDMDALSGSLFSMENTLDLVDFLISLVPIPKLGSDMISKLIRKGAEIKRDYDKSKTSYSRYTSTFTSQRGGIYEHDAYSALIEKVIERIRNQGKRAILLIEDLDRIDPAHLFRILNVFGAHLDDVSSSNKFGFDNIIVVMDYEITEHIFHHFYGEHANYPGYMNKFMSSYPYKYSITSIARGYLYDYMNHNCGLDMSACSNFIVRRNHDMSNLYLSVVIDKLSIRDIVKILDGIETQYVCTDIELRRNCVISTKQRIVIFLSILIRMGIDMNHLKLMNALHNSNKLDSLNLLGSFMLIDPAIIGNQYFYINSQGITISVIKKDGVDICEFTKDASGYPFEGKIDAIMDRALRKACTYVHDWPQN